MEYILDVQDIHTFIGQYHILQGVTVKAPKGSITALLGRNGAGKTTTLKSILGLTPPRQGKVVYNNREIQGMRSFDIASLGIGFVPEHRAIFRDLSVEENLKIAERKKGDYARKQEFIFSLFPDLRRLISLSGTNLSGGQQQMLAIARGFQIHHKQGLFSFDFLRIFSLPFHADQYCTLMVAKVNRQFDQFVGLGYVVNLDDGSHPYINFVKKSKRNGRFDGSNFNRSHYFPLNFE